MKKIFAAVLCIALATTTSFAKGHQNNNHAHHDTHKVEQQHRPMHDPVVDMKLINQMGLPAKKVEQIKQLQASKQHEMAAHRAKAAQLKDQMRRSPQNQGSKIKDPKFAHQKGQRNHLHAEMKAFKETYRKELRHIMGTDKYVLYVERQNDQLAAHRAHRGHRHGKKAQHGHQKA